MNGVCGVVLFAVRIGGRKADIEAGLGEKPFLDSDDDRQVEYRIVRGDLDDRSFLVGLHDVLFSTLQRRWAYAADPPVSI